MPQNRSITITTAAHGLGTPARYPIASFPWPVAQREETIRRGAVKNERRLRDDGAGEERDWGSGNTTGQEDNLTYGGRAVRGGR
jgi:hypothetical protein